MGIFFFSFRNPRNGREKNNEQTFRFHHSWPPPMTYYLRISYLVTLRGEWGRIRVIVSTFRSPRFSSSIEFKRILCFKAWTKEENADTHTHVLEISPLLRIAVWLFFFLFFLMRNLLCSNLFSIQKFERSQLKKIDKKVCEKYCGAKAEQQILVSLSQLISLYLIPPIVKVEFTF